MHDVETFAVVITCASLAAVAAVMSNWVSERLRVPAPVIFLLVAAVASQLYPPLGNLSVEAVQRIVTLALAVILFDGGLNIGRRRLRAALAPVLWIGVVGTFVTAAAVAALAHYLFAFDWRVALLLGTALAPTDPAVVFSVLGRREVAGRAGTILEGESGANDPVGIALLVSLVAAGGDLTAAAAGSIAGTFALQMVVGAAVGVGGGWLMLQAIRKLPLPSDALYPLRTLAISLALYGLATVAHGSGFLAVFVAGIMLGDAGAPFKREIERFHSSLAGLAEIVAFVILGLTVSLRDVVATGAWWMGLLLAVLLAFVVRPLLVGPLLAAVRMTVGERVFVLWSGLKGAVPILLGTYILAGGTSEAGVVYNVIVVVVTFSVVVQGGLVPSVAARCRVRMEDVEPRPFALGMRLRDQPEGAREYRVESGAQAVGMTVAELHEQQDVWVSLVVRDGAPVSLGAQTVFQAGDEVLLLVEPSAEPDAAFVAR
jgi:cell volume regulation protein A